MIEVLPPGALLLLGGLLLPLMPARLRQVALLALPILSGLHLYSMPIGHLVHLEMFGQQLTPIRIDELSLVWGVIFHIAAFLAMLFSIHIKDVGQHVAAMTYMGSAIGAAFAGDMMTLFVFWELTAITSVFLIWASRTQRAYKTGMRYLIIQVLSGVLLLAGVLVFLTEGGSIEFGHLGLGSTGRLLIFLAFGIKAAFPLLHNWLVDAYPEATVTGTVVLSTFTTKLAIYALARAFAGTEYLIPIGAAMTAFPIFFAVIENDLRRVLAYSLNNQLGFMVVGVGIGTEMALNGTAAHAFCHILYKSLLFMSMGAVLYRTGTIKGSELGGLYKSMPWTTGFCIVGAASISAFPLTNGFVSKSLILSEAAHHHATIAYFILMFASAGVFHHSGIKIPFFAFFAHDSKRRVKEAPWNMLLAMGLTAFGCIAIGMFPRELLYGLLPYEVDYHPYTGSHVITQLQLLLFSALAFSVLMRSGVYPPELRSVNLDTDVIYRRLLPGFIQDIGVVIARVQRDFSTLALRVVDTNLRQVRILTGPEGVFARTWATSSAVVWVLVLLTVFLVLYYRSG